MDTRARLQSDSTRQQRVCQDPEESEDPGAEVSGIASFIQMPHRRSKAIKQKSALKLRSLSNLNKE